MTKSEQEIIDHANMMCEFGRMIINRSERNQNPKNNRVGLRILTGGLIQQNPLRERPDNLKLRIWGIERS
ncbi:MAG: hypothetical protein Q7T59_01490 [Candidatus Woesebacteria bacterium]|nr:hypothetical protein [Candidatus Woesebacteria bacterium]